MLATIMYFRTINNNMLSDKLKTLLAIFECSNVNRIAKDGSFVPKNLSKENRLKILNLLKGDL